MKKLLLASLLGLVSFATSANNVVGVVLDPKFQVCKGTTVTVQFVAYMEQVCTVDIYSPVYPVPGTYNLDAVTTWLPNTLAMPSYETFSAIICIQCPGMSAPFCLPAVGIDMVPGHACDPAQTQSVQVQGNCCTPTIGANVVGGGGGGTCFTLTVTP